MALEPLGTDEGERGETPENPGITVLLNFIQQDRKVSGSIPPGAPTSKLPT